MEATYDHLWRPTALSFGNTGHQARQSQPRQASSVHEPRLADIVIAAVSMNV